MATASAVKLRTKWDSVLLMGTMHVIAIGWAVQTFSWPAFWTFIVTAALTGLFGVTLCYHRLLAHRSFSLPKPLEYALAVFGCMAFQNGPVKWVATHRVHHAYSDRPQDPHSPTRGFWWAHVGWLLVHDDFLDHWDRYAKWAPDLAKDRVHKFLNDTHGWYQIILAGLLYALGGWPFVVWGVFVRTVFVWHGTWLVNSASHIWGYRTYSTGERSTNNWWVAALTFGEGWHNNHHAFLSSAAHGLRWWEVDVTYATIRVLGWVGLATQIRVARPAEQVPSIPLEDRPDWKTSLPEEAVAGSAS
ncbi:MAG: fatty acid desaturase [Candidatus Omnitrophica bacterium]|nr:fatty acid desaturase [Candidatus Omnitrophota bacterium]